MKTVDEYINDFENPIKDQLIILRNIIKETIPDVEEKLSWGAPTYYYHGYLIQFAGYKKHIGFYTTPSTIEKFKEELKGYKTNSKNTTQFPIDKPLPTELIKKMILFRVEENNL